MTGDAAFTVLAVIQRELLLFCGVWFAVGAVDDIAIDLLWLWGEVRRRWHRRGAVHAARIGALPPPATSGRIAVLVAAWQEQGVIGAMLDVATTRWAGQAVTIFVGCYPNDPGTIAEVIRAGAHGMIRLVIHHHAGPTTKGDNLNRLWRAVVEEERRCGIPFKAVALHDAEDLVHADEPRLFNLFVERKALVQLPVVPVPVAGSRWVSGHYCDEFAEAHAKQLVVREAVGAGLPLAGVGCAIERAMLGRLAAARDGHPFDPNALTEDYELGLSVGALGGDGMLLRVLDAQGSLVATRAHFPATLEGAVRQKSRWLAGIALMGWDRLGWRGGVAEFWMRLHDRRATFAAIVLSAAYAAILVQALLAVATFSGWGHTPPLAPVTRTLLVINLALLIVRLIVRSLFVARQHGWSEGLYSIPRAIVANLIAILSARRAMFIYLRYVARGTVTWDKTAHIFPRLAHD